MLRARPSTSAKPRELRRRVVLPARVCSASHWQDACILNLSSRGLMIRSGCTAEPGSPIHVHVRDHAIIATVVWRSAGRAGLRAEDRVPVDDIMALAAVDDRHAHPCIADRRRAPRSDHQMRGRAIEYVGVLAIAGGLAVGTLKLLSGFFVRPMAAIAAALGS